MLIKNERFNERGNIMKCRKCKEADIVWDDEVIRMNEKKQITYNHSIGHCPKCNVTYEIDNMGTNGRAKNSSFSILSTILVGFIFTAPIGIIMAMVDLIKGSPDEDHTFSILSIFIGVIILGLIYQAIYL